MGHATNLQPVLRQQASDLLSRLSPLERELLLIKCWMSHDARWFMAVAREFGMETANRLNQMAAHDIGMVEAQRIVRALQLPPALTLDDFMLMQEIFISLLGPDLLDYRMFRTGDDAYQVHVQRCFAYDHISRVGVADTYDCGVFARVAGWFDAVGSACEISPPLNKCRKAQGQECIYTISMRRSHQEAGE
jgi:uncharacterized protein DUF6125